MGRASQPTVLYDAECEFCRWSLAKLLAWDRPRQLCARPIDSAEGQRLLADLRPDERETSWHFIDRDGERRSAGRAAAPLLRELPGGRPLAALLASFPGPTDSAYDWVSEHRPAFTKLISAGAVRRADTRITSRC